MGSTLVGYLSETNVTNVHLINTGDVLLFKGSGRGANLIMLGTRSPWTHVGIAYWSGTPLKLFVFESVLTVSAFDHLTGEEKTGVRLVEFSAVADRYRVCFVRKIAVSRGIDFYTKTDEFIQEMKGKPYTSFFKVPFSPFFCFEDQGVHCSELVFRYLSKIGLVAGNAALEDKCPNRYTPGDFSPRGSIPEMDQVFQDFPMHRIYRQFDRETGIYTMFVFLILAGLVGMLVVYQLKKYRGTTGLV